MRSEAKRLEQRRGFTIVVVILITALLAIAGFLVLDLLDVEHRVGRIVRLTEEAREVAEGAAREVVNDRTVADAYPTPASTNLAVDYTPSTNSAFDRAADAQHPKRDYTANIAFVRSMFIQETEIGDLRAFLYEVTTDSAINDNESSSRVRAHITSMRTSPSQITRHAR